MKVKRFTYILYQFYQLFVVPDIAETTTTTYIPLEISLFIFIAADFIHDITQGSSTKFHL